MNIQTYVQIESEVGPGVAYKVKRLTEGQRFALLEEVAEFDRLRADAADAIERLEAKGELTAVQRLECDCLWLKVAKATDASRTRWLEECIFDLTGLTIDDEAAGVSEAIRHARELAAEMEDHVMRQNKLAGDDAGNSESPTTSPDPAVGETNASTASNANGSGTTASATAANTSPS